MAKVLLGVTGSVAAIYTPNLFDDLKCAGHEVRIVATQSACYFFDPAGLASTPTGERDKNVITLDADEWPGTGYQRGDPVLHIELRRWADLFVIAPCDANTLAKLALGITDNCMTCVYRAWDRTRPVVIAPAMNTLMWEHPVTARHLAQIAADLGLAFRLVAPIEKKLACNDIGLGAMAERDEIVKAIGAQPLPSTKGNVNPV